MEKQFETWKPVFGYEGRYEVSDIGRVRSIGITYKTPFGYATKKGRIIKIKIGNVGYPRVSLSKNCTGREFNVHRLVAQAFILNTENKPVVNHKDSDKLNNRVDNLEWCTRSENSKHASYNGSFSHLKKKGIQNLTSKPVINTITKIVLSRTEAAKELNMSISAFCKRMNNNIPNNTIYKPI